ncbi:MAG: AAA family ATPase [Cyanobacteria bacterium SBLK]|nr:AAA family ATPase [Cyanobacteria bacterium SBLK]
MKLQKLEYEDRKYKWKLNDVEFSSSLNLLVGVSGAGKTQILKAIRQLKRIANGSSLNGVCWDVVFSTQDNNIYRWSGKFEVRQNNLLFISDPDDESEYKILYEYLTKNNESLVERTQEKGIIFKNKSTPKLSSFKSVVELLGEEEYIKPVKKEFDKIIITEFPDYSNDLSELYLPASISKKYEHCDLAAIKNAELPIHIKLPLVYKYIPTTFNQIKSTFTEIFNKVEDIKIEPFNQDEISLALIDIFKEVTIVKIKEKNLEFWIRQDNISSGMFKTLMYISQLYLSPDHCVILIDEFENSLGVNCIDSVTDLICENRNLQFIITSHHPYIINNISPKYWKIVTRKGNSVTVKKAEDFHISESRQKAFIDLINVLEDEEEQEDE